MLLARTVELGDRYRRCPICSSAALGKDQGRLLIQGNMFIRECKCGWAVKIDVSEPANKLNQGA